MTRKDFEEILKEGNSVLFLMIVLISRINIVTLVIFCCLISWIFCFSVYSAVHSESSSHISPLPIHEALKIDGYLTEKAWQEATKVEIKTQYTPDEGKASSEQTFVYLCYNKTHLYLAFQCFVADINNLRQETSTRDSIKNSDVVGIALDPFSTHKEAYLFEFTPEGVVLDYLMKTDMTSFHGWNADVMSIGRILEDGYIVELAIPFQALLMPRRDVQNWGFYAFRYIKCREELSVWPPRTHQVPSYLSQMGFLEGITGIESSRRHLFVPYMSGFISNVDEELSGGFDYQFRINPAHNLNLTLCPDYSQIEADPDRIETTERYDEWLPERRVFFSEDADILTSDVNLCYSRKIKNPEIGLKLAGRDSVYQFAFLSVLEEEMENGDRNAFNIARVKYFLFEDSFIGFLFTNKHTVESQNHNEVLSIDNFLRYRDVYSLSMQIANSWTNLEGYKENSLAYYLQTSLDNSRTSSQLYVYQFPQDFRAEIGSIWDKECFSGIGFSSKLFFREKIGFLNEIRPFAGVESRKNLQNSENERYIWTGFESVSDTVTAKLRFANSKELVGDDSFESDSITLELWHTPTGWMNHHVSFRVGDAVNYEDSYLGFDYKLDYELTMTLSKRLSISGRISREDFYDSFHGRRQFTQTIIWNKISFNMLPSMTLRSIFQYNDLITSSDISLLYIWEFSSLNILYVGVNSFDFSKAAMVDESWEAFFKLSLFFRC